MSYELARSACRKKNWVSGDAIRYHSRSWGDPKNGPTTGDVESEEIDFHWLFVGSKRCSRMGYYSIVSSLPNNNLYLRYCAGIIDFVSDDDQLAYHRSIELAQQILDIGMTLNKCTFILK